jgi:hypothetical protein
MAPAAPNGAGRARRLRSKSPAGGDATSAHSFPGSRALLSCSAVAHTHILRQATRRVARLPVCRRTELCYRRGARRAGGSWRRSPAAHAGDLRSRDALVPRHVTASGAPSCVARGCSLSFCPLADGAAAVTGAAARWRKHAHACLAPGTRAHRPRLDCPVLGSAQHLCPLPWCAPCTGSALAARWLLTPAFVARAAGLSLLVYCSGLLAPARGLPDAPERATERGIYAALALFLGAKLLLPSCQHAA